MTVAGVDRAGHVSTLPPHGANEAPEGDVLPAPAEGGIDLLALRRLLLLIRDSSLSSDRARIDADEARVEQAIAAAADARRREAENRSEEGGFFDGLLTAAEAFTVDLVKIESITDPFGTLEASAEKAGDATINSRQFWADLEKGALEVGKWAAVAGSVALAVVSCGSAAPIAALAIAGAVMSCAAAAESSFQVLEKCGVDQDTAMWIGVGLSVGGAIASGGAGAFQALGAGAQAAQAGSTAVRSASIAANGVSVAAGVAGGVAHVQVAAFERDAKEASADTKEAVQRQARLERLIQRTLDALRDAVASCERGTRRVAEAIKIEHKTNLAMMRV